MDADQALREAYGAPAPVWARGPAAVYERLAQRLIADSPVPLGGRRVLDVGAGTGAVSRAVTRAGGRCVAVDASVGALAHDRAQRPPAVAADARHLPFPGACFDAVTAGCVLSHVPDPRAVLAEARRVLRSGGVLLASAFPAGDEHPAKARIEAALAACGYRPPAWYQDLKTRYEAQVAEPAALSGFAHTAGLIDVRVTRHQVDTGLRSPEEFVSWRLGMAQHRAFLAGLSPERQEAVRQAAVAAAGSSPPPLVMALLVLEGRVLQAGWSGWIEGSGVS